MTLKLRLRARLERVAHAAEGLVFALVLAALVLAACGVKAPPKPVKPEAPAQGAGESKPPPKAEAEPPPKQPTPTK